METKLQHPDSPFLLKYPLLLANTLYGNIDCGLITSRMITFANTYDDTEDFIEEIKIIVPKVFSNKDAGVLDQQLRLSLCGLTFESGGANVNWIVKKGEDCDEALLIKLMCLCHCVGEEDIGVSSAFQDIAGYALRNRRREVLTILWAASCDFLLSYPLHDFREVLFFHLSVCVAAGLPTLACQELTAKLASKGDIEYAKRILIGWLKPTFDHAKEVEEFLSIALSPRTLSDFTAEFEEIHQKIHPILRLIKQRFG